MSLEDTLEANGLEEKLDKLIEENPNKYSNSCVERVRKLVEYEKENPTFRRPWDKSFKEINDFILYYNLHTKWQGKSAKEMQKDKNSGASAFYDAFYDYLRKQVLSKEERKKLNYQIFKPKQKTWLSYTIIDNWIAEFKKHPEWQGNSTKEMQKDKNSGANSFYHAFKDWTKKNSKSEEERKNLIKVIFPVYKAPFKYSFGDSVVYFDSYKERILGLLLHKYGLIKEFQQGKNLHIRTNGTKLHSIDFLAGNIFIEYHPLHIKEIKKGITLEEAGKLKENSITNPEYKGFGFYHIWEVGQLYNLLKKKEINPLIDSKYADITKEQFDEHVSETYKKTVKYDSEHSNQPQ